MKTTYAPKSTLKKTLTAVGQEHAKGFTDFKNMQVTLFNGIFTDSSGRHYANLIAIDEMGSSEYQLAYLKDANGIFIGDPDHIMGEFDG